MFIIHGDDDEDDDWSSWEMLDSNADNNNVITCPIPPPFFSFCSNIMPVVEDSRSVVPAAIVLLLLLMATFRCDGLLLWMMEWRWNDVDDGLCTLLWVCPAYDEIQFLWIIDDVGIKKLAVDGAAAVVATMANRRRMAWRTTTSDNMVQSLTNNVDPRIKRVWRASVTSSTFLQKQIDAPTNGRW